MTREKEMVHNNRRFRRVKVKCSAHAQKIQNGVHLQGCACSTHFMNLVILSWMKISTLRCTSSTKAKGNCVEMKYILFFYMELARLKEVERKKERKKEKESEENQENWDFRPIMERLDGKG